MPGGKPVEEWKGASAVIKRHARRPVEHAGLPAAIDECEHPAVLSRLWRERVGQGQAKHAGGACRGLRAGRTMAGGRCWSGVGAVRRPAPCKCDGKREESDQQAPQHDPPIMLDRAAIRGTVGLGTDLTQGPRGGLAQPRRDLALERADPPSSPPTNSKTEITSRSTARSSRSSTSSTSSPARAGRSCARSCAGPPTAT